MPLQGEGNASPSDFVLSVCRLRRTACFLAGYVLLSMFVCLVLYFADMGQSLTTLLSLTLDHWT